MALPRPQHARPDTKPYRGQNSHCKPHNVIAVTKKQVKYQHACPPARLQYAGCTPPQTQLTATIWGYMNLRKYVR